MLARRAYYSLKPFLPWSLRIALRRKWAERQKVKFCDSWPISESAGKPPEGWPGWPEGKKFAFVLTHDVESQKGLDRCRRLMELEDRLGFRSSFNLIPEGDYQTPRELRDALTGAGFEVGAHDLRHDGKLYRNRATFRAHAQRINHYLKEWNAVGFRSGFMHHNLEWLHDLDVLYDASTFDTDPFEPQPDGVGTIFPFWVPGKNGRGYVELPYSLVQDFNLFIVLQEKTIETWTRKLEWIVAHGGMATLIVHPDYIDFSAGPPSKDEFPAALYEEFLCHVKKTYSGIYWHALPREVAQYIARHKENCLKPDLKVEGSGSSDRRSAAPNRNLRGELHDSPYATREDSSTARGFDASPVVASSAARLQGKRAAVVVYSHYPSDPRPRRAAEALVQRGMMVDLICLGQGDGEPLRETFNGVNILRVPFKKNRGGMMAYGFQYSAFILITFTVMAFRSLFRRYRLVHVHNMPDVLVFSALVPKILGAKVIMDLHDPMPELMVTIFNLKENQFSVRLLKHLEKWSIAFADLVLTVNLASKRIFTSRSCPPEKVQVIMNSPDEKIFGFCPVTSDASTDRNRHTPFVIMYHGSLVERNGVDLAVDALEKVRRSIPSAELRIYGFPTPFSERVMQSVQTRGLQDSIRYLGARSLEQIVEAIGECDLGLVPNRRSAFTEMNTPTRIFEYLARAKPVIAPRSPGILDYFSGEDLIYFELGDVDDLARKIEWAFFHPGEVHEVLKRGQQICLDHRWSRESSRFVGAVGDLLGCP